jgi:hypothetical protein
MSARVAVGGRGVPREMTYEVECLPEDMAKSLQEVEALAVRCLQTQDSLSWIC